ncbi:MAG: GntR family transcriptional regulator [Acidimicrobiia bacterium]
MRYLDLAETLRHRIADGAGGALPSEAALGAEFGVSRVTVRRALELLRGEGLVHSRRGAGWFVAMDPIRQPLGRITTLEAALEAAGASPSRHVLEFAFETAPNDVAKTLGLATGLVGDGAETLRVTRLNLADDEPFALVTVWVPAALGEHLSRAAVEQSTFTDLLPLHGVEPGRITQTITAVAAEGLEATRLGVPRGSPLLACQRVTYDRDGTAVMVSQQRYAAHLTALEVEFSPGGNHG